MRYGTVTATTRTKCEGCGRSLAPQSLYAAHASDLMDLDEGTPFYFRLARHGQAEIGHVLNTVCSPACDLVVTARKRPLIAAAVEAQQRDAWRPDVPRVVVPREASKYVARIRAAVQGDAC